MRAERSLRRTLFTAIACFALGAAVAGAQQRCERFVVANVVALDQPIVLNRLGATIPGGMMFALARDVVDKTTGQSCDNGVQNVPPTRCRAGEVALRKDKRPRPIVLRANEGDCLKVVFTNLLTPGATSATAASVLAAKTESAQAARAADQGDQAQQTQQLDTEANILQREAAEADGTLRGKPRLSETLVKDLAEKLLPPRPTLETVAAAAAPPPVVTRQAGVHVQGMTWVSPPVGVPPQQGMNDGSYIGANANSLAHPGETKIYTLFAEHEGSFVLYSTADDWNPVNAAGGSLAFGLFGSVNVQPSESDVKPFGKKWDSEWYRSQVTEQELCLATAEKTHKYDPATGCVRVDPEALPVIDYQALYPGNYKDRSRANLPVLNMLCNAAAVAKGACQENEIVHTDLTAIITGPNVGTFPVGIPPADQPPALRAISLLPDRLQPYREFTAIYHESFSVTQAFPQLYSTIKSLGSAGDNFGINYGMGGIASEILANRLGVGPMQDCKECKYEEFFLSSWAVGDPAMIVDNSATDRCSPAPGVCIGGSACTVGGQNQCSAQTCNTSTKLCSDGVTSCSKKGDADCQKCSFTQYVCDGPKATVASYPADPSNVYPSYIGDHVRFRVLHDGSDLHHVHHQHAHQWLHTPNSPDADYTDSQSIGPGSAYTMEMVYYGSGNVNQTVGDSIFHCHFYAHFASGMWSLWRTLDTLQMGTEIDPATGAPKKGARAYPDGEIAAGTPIPAVVPVPTLPLPRLPAPVRLTADGKHYEVQLVDAKGAKGDWVNPLQGGMPAQAYRNPGYPFFVPGIAGHRPPHPPLDFAYACSDNGLRCSPGTAGEPKDLTQCQNPQTAQCEPLDGGLPRHVIADTKASLPAPNNTDFSKILHESEAYQLAEDGTVVEKIAMQSHAQRLTPTCRPNGVCAGICSDNGAPCDLAAPNPVGRWQCASPAAATCLDRPVTFVLNGLGPKPGAPYADPCIKFTREGGPAPDSLTRRYLAADVQLDAIFNKEGWHFPQQRMISLWGDVKSFVDRKKPPEPFFFRANSNDCIEYTLANLVPNVYELDEFQVRTPTDILGQHIHLVKFDVTSSDGAGNGWNYEDGTFAPNEVTERIGAINDGKDKGIDRQYMPGNPGPLKLTPKAIKFFGPGPGGTWMGAQATIQRWFADPLFDNTGACSNNPDLECTLTDLRRCGDPMATCDVSAGFCSNNRERTCTASSRVNRCGRDAECIAKYDRTLRTVFTHDHFGPSTHQQAGLYAGLVIEPKGSVWHDNQSGAVFGGFDAKTGGVTKLRFDGGPTTWQAVIAAKANDQSFREFLLELQDTALMYQPFTVRDFVLDATNPGWKTQFAGGKTAPCKPGEPCGFCGNDGVCVNTQTGLPVSPVKSCLVPVPFSTTNPCGTNQACRLAAGQLVACTPEEFSQCQGQPYDDPKTNPSGVFKSCKLLAGIPGVAWGTTAIDPSVKSKSPEVITFFAATNNFSFNYRNEPLFPRLADPFSGEMLPGEAGDLSYVYSSAPSISRRNPRGSVCSGNLAQACNASNACPSGTGVCQPVNFCSDNYALCTAAAGTTAGNLTLCGDPKSAKCDRTFPYPSLTAGVQPGDPFTPLLRAYAGDDVQFRTLTGAHLNPHNFTIQGMNWLMQPSFVDSGWRNSQVMGISEHFDLISRMPSSFAAPSADFLYQPGAAAIEQASGNWGLIRAYSQAQSDLYPVPRSGPPPAQAVSVCPATQPQGTQVRTYNVVAVATTLTYNQTQGLSDTNGLVLYRCPAGQALASCAPPSGWVPEPLVLRAGAGDCLKVNLRNTLAAGTAIPGASNLQETYPPGCTANCAQSKSNTSLQVGLRPQLVAFDPRQSGGANVGLNPLGTSGQPLQTAGPGETVSYTWYAGNVDAAAPAAQRHIPIEFGAANLLPSDVLNHYEHGLFGGLIIEPFGSSGWENAGTQAVVTETDGSKFREAVIFTQDDLTASNGTPIEGANYKSEYLFTSTPRFCSLFACQNAASGQNVACMFAQSPSSPGKPPQLFCKNSAGTCAPCTFTPETPIFTACAGESVRFRVLHPGGINTDQVFELYGHNWSEAPYMTQYDHCEPPIMHTNLWASQEQGTTNLCANRAYTLDRNLSTRSAGDWEASLNAWQGARMGQGPTNHLDVIVAQAGGPFKQPGDYLYRTYSAMHFELGLWGIFRVETPVSRPDLCRITLRPDSMLKNQLPSGGGSQ